MPFIFLFLIFLQFLQAQDTQKLLTIGIFAKTQYYKYTEPSVMNIQGVMPGFEIFTRFNLERSRHTLSLEYFRSDSNRYDGSECLIGQGSSSCYPLKANSSDYYYDLRYTAGLFPYFSYRFTSFWELGLGYRYLENMGKGRGFYKREQDYMYIHSGYNLEFYVSDFELMARINLMRLLSGSNKSHMSALGYKNDLNFKQNSGFGIRLEGGAATYIKDSGSRFLAGIYFEYWDIARSNTDFLFRRDGTLVSSFVEPENNTKTFGIYAGVEF